MKIKEHKTLAEMAVELTPEEAKAFLAVLKAPPEEMDAHFDAMTIPQIEKFIELWKAKTKHRGISLPEGVVL